MEADQQHDFIQSMKDKFCDIFLISLDNYERIKHENSLDVLKSTKGIYLIPQRQRRKLPSRLPSQDLLKSQKYKDLEIPDLFMKEKLSTMKNYYLIHSNYSKNQAINYDFLATEIDNYSKLQHPTLANFKGYILRDINENPVPTVMTERPVNGPLISFFETIKKNQKEDKSNNQFSFDKKDFYPSYDLDYINSVTPEQKFVIILGIIAGVVFIHKKNFIHSNLNPTTIYLNKYYHPVICDYAFNIPFLIKQRDEAEEDISEYGYEEEEDDDEIAEEENDILNLKPRNDIKFSYYPDDNNANPKFDHPAYIAPEVFNKDPKKCFDELADIYSIGMLIYFILTESEPILDEKEVKLPYLDNLNDYWRKIIKKCLSINPKDRYAAKELFDELSSEDKIGLYLSALPDSQSDHLSDESKPYVLFLIQDLNPSQKDYISIYNRIIPNPAEIDYNDRLIIYAAEEGNKECLEKIGTYFETGIHKFLKDDSCAFYCFENAKSRLYSHIKYAEFLQKGIGTQKNLQEALTAYKEIKKQIDKTHPYYNEIQKRIQETKDELDDTHSVIFTNVPKDLNDKDIKNHLCSKCTVDIETIPNKDSNSDSVTKKVIFNNILGKNILMKNYKKNPNNFGKIKCEIIKEYVQPEIDMLSSLKNAEFQQIDPNDYVIKDSYCESGSYGTTYLVTSNNGDKYAAKIYFTIRNDEFEKINKIKREVILSTKFDQSTILKIIGYSPESIKTHLKGNPTLIMNFIPNGSLERMITREAAHQKLPPQWNDTTKIKIIIGIAHAMACIHIKNIIHRDLKTENILLDINYEPVIADFGSSKEFSPVENVAMTRKVGSVAYMAPEVYIYAHSYKWEVDVYSFGIILYQIIKAMPIGAIYNEVDEEKLFLNYIKPGIKPPIDDMNDIFQELIESCWNNQIDARPNFQSIYEKLTEAVNHNEKLLPNVDIEEVREYIRRLDKDNDE